jgi:cytidine deaminase
MIDADTLLNEARAAALASWSPYSRFRVGAAVAAGRQVFRGCNVENASYGLAICAERNAIFAAVAAGHRRIEAIAVACIDGGAGSAGSAGAALMPCGACLQVMREFADAALPVHIDRGGSTTLEKLLPRPFALD